MFFCHFLYFFIILKKLRKLRMSFCSKRYLLLIIILLLFASTLYSKEKWAITKPIRGEGIITLLQRFSIEPTEDYIALFKNLNKNIIDKNEGLFRDRNYKLPIIIYKYNGKSIRSSINVSLDIAKEIQEYNNKLLERGLVQKSYKVTKELWVPALLLDTQSNEELIEKKSEDSKNDKSVEKSKKSTKKTKKTKKETYVLLPIFGEKYEKVFVIDSLLKDNIYYLDAGHGGPDPGAIGTKGKHKLHEDEYAYDIILRLGRRLVERGAQVYFIVQDPKDGIRDEEILENSSDEYYLGGDSIAYDKVQRLNDRVDIINKLYVENASKSKKQQQISIHLDSRPNVQRIDVFFYYKEGNKKSEELANNLFTTIESKYNKYQPGRGYSGSVSSRNLLMLRKTKVTAVYIELGNIQNPNDQYRFLKVKNRQAIADWLFDGLLKSKDL